MTDRRTPARDGVAIPAWQLAVAALLFVPMIAGLGLVMLSIALDIDVFDRAIDIGMRVYGAAVFVGLVVLIGVTASVCLLNPANWLTAEDVESAGAAAVG